MIVATCIILHLHYISVLQVQSILWGISLLHGAQISHSYVTDPDQISEFEVEIGTKNSCEQNKLYRIMT